MSRTFSKTGLVNFDEPISKKINKFMHFYLALVKNVRDSGVITKKMNVVFIMDFVILLSMFADFFTSAIWPLR